MTNAWLIRNPRHRSWLPGENIVMATALYNEARFAFRCAFCISQFSQFDLLVPDSLKAKPHNYPLKKLKPHQLPTTPVQRNRKLIPTSESVETTRSFYRYPFAMPRDGSGLTRTYFASLRRTRPPLRISVCAKFRARRLDGDLHHRLRNLDDFRVAAEGFLSHAVEPGSFDSV